MDFISDHTSTPPEAGPSDGGLPACTLSMRMMYRECGCGNLCVAVLACMSPILMLLSSCVVYGICTGCMHVWIFLARAHYSRILEDLYADDECLREQQRLERRALEAIQRLPSMLWGGARNAECSLCMEGFKRGEVVRKLPCGHQYHLNCIDRWLVHGQRNHAARRCPLCGRNPLDAPLDESCRRGSAGSVRPVIGPEERRHSSPLLPRRILV